jgi:hypothetical protein
METGTQKWVRENPEFPNPPTGPMTKEKFDALFYEYTGPIEVREFTPYEQKFKALMDEEADFAWLHRVEPPSKVVTTLTFIRNVPILIEKYTQKGTKFLAESLNQALRANRISPAYHPNSIEKLDQTKISGVVSVRLVKEAMIIMGLQVIVHRLAQLEREKIDELANTITGATVGFMGKLVITTAELKTVFGNIVNGIQASLNAQAQAAIELGIRNECYAVLLKLIDQKFKQNRKFEAGETRIYKIVSARKPNIQEPENLP